MSRDGWFAQNFEVDLPDDPTERAEYVAELEALAEHGPADDPTDPQGVRA